MTEQPEKEPRPVETETVTDSLVVWVVMLLGAILGLLAFASSGLIIRLFGGGQ